MRIQNHIIMKKFNLYLFVPLMFAVICHLPAKAFDFPLQSGINKTIVLKKGTNRVDNGRPNSPELNIQCITCNYDGESLNITFTTSEGTCRGYVVQEASQIINLIFFDSTQLEVNLPLNLTSNYYIEFTTEKGNTYYGSTSVE